MPLPDRISRILRLFTAPMALLAAGRLPRLCSSPHSGGAPHPETPRRGTRLRSACGWEPEALLAEPAAAENLAKVPAAERILRRRRRSHAAGSCSSTAPPGTRSGFRRCDETASERRHPNCGHFVADS